MTQQERREATLRTPRYQMLLAIINESSEPITANTAARLMREQGDKSHAIRDVRLMLLRLRNAGLIGAEHADAHGSAANVTGRVWLFWRQEEARP